VSDEQAVEGVAPGLAADLDPSSAAAIGASFTTRLLASAQFHRLAFLGERDELREVLARAPSAYSLRRDGWHV
jgi:hypothetical protein